MKNNIGNVIIILSIIAIGVIVIFFLISKTNIPQRPLVNNFEKCVSAGYPVLESYPRKCNTPDGKNFIEDIGNELEKIDLIKVVHPRPNQTIQNPILIKGEARGYWFFEATFPVKIIGDNGEVISQHYAQAQGEWMTEDFVPFEAKINFEIENTQKGTLILEKSNPSDLPENYDELRIPVVLKKNENSFQTINLYYYNPNLDKDEADNILCSRQGLVAVERKIPTSKTPIQDTIKLLLSGNLTDEERGKGITTEYPLDEFSLTGASLKDKILTLEFLDPNNKSVGGSCRVGVLWLQIEETAKQFSEVEQVRFLPEYIFQP